MDDLRQRLESALSGTYVFERELGGGGMSRTYVARETALDRRVVVKVLAPELLAGISVERFRREVLLAAKLQHPHVVPVLSAGDSEGLPWFTMPYVEGDSLRQRLGRGPLGIGEVVSILRDVSRALAYAHSHNIVHRDIKPDNVLLSAGSATVTDFGIAKAISAARTTGDGGGHSTMLTIAGTSIGTPAYMAPEQAAGDPNTDWRADLYSFGAMAYELLTGRPPFHGLSPAKLLAAHLGETPKDVRILRSDCPDTLADLVMKCLAKEPGERPQQASDMVRVLDNITSSGAATAAPAILAGGRIRLMRAIAIWAGSTVLTAITAWAATKVVGLPDWVFPGSVGVMMAGLPAILATWYVQKVAHRAYTATPAFTPGGSTAAHGTMATLAIKAVPHVSWRRTWMGGAIAVGGFAAIVIAFMVMRAMGVGPFGSLRGRGVFGERETLVVADFVAKSDSALGGTVAEALRTDLGQSNSLKVLTRANLRDILGLMQRPKDAMVPYELAREIATREGAKAVLDGEVTRLGKSYVVSARLVNAMDGTELAKFSETANGEDDLVPALGKLSRAVRERTGESLRHLQKSSELERVSTPSLAALRKYVEGSQMSDERGEPDKAIALLREAVAIDSGFAMAWRKLAVVIGNEGNDRTGQQAAAQKAYDNRGRLTEMERLLTEGYYFTNGPHPDNNKALASYEAALLIDSTSTSALNNAAVIYNRLEDFKRSAELFKRVIALPRTFGGAFTNLAMAQMRLGDTAGLAVTAAAMKERLPNSNDLWEVFWYKAHGTGRDDVADSISRAVSATAKTSRQAIRSAGSASGLMAIAGRPREALKWAKVSTDALQKAQPGPESEFTHGIDTLTTFLEGYGQLAEARAVLQRTMQRVPLAKMSAADRPTIMLARVAYELRDPALARQMHEQWVRDGRPATNDPAGRDAMLSAMEAGAQQKWDAMIAKLREAMSRTEIRRLAFYEYMGQAFDFAGMPDSAIVYLEQFTTTPDPTLDETPNYLAVTHRRLGELYEAKGDKAKAIFHYEKFVDQWKNAEPELQPKVRDVQARLAKLRGLKG